MEHNHPIIIIMINKWINKFDVETERKEGADDEV